MAWRYVIMIHPKARVAHCRLTDFAPTMKPVGVWMFPHDIHAQVTYLCADKPVNAEDRKFKRPVRLEQLGFYTRVSDTPALYRKPRE